MDYYKILQVSAEAEPEVIEAAYKRLSAKYHPDVNRSADADERMKQINEAYSVLKDPDTREKYDLSQKALTQRGEFDFPVLFAKLKETIESVVEFLKPIDEAFGTPCPKCGTKSFISETKVEQNTWEKIWNSQRTKCRNCGHVR